jgi:deoxyribodipyrimidine photo-lyase
MYTKRGIMWFRQDLRLHDNEALVEALSHTDEIIPVYVFDERQFEGNTALFKFRKTGKFRAKFIIESVRDLRARLRARGSDLIVRVGKPEEEIFEIAKLSKSNWVFCNRERTRDEVAVQDALEQNLWSVGQEMRYSRGKLLYYTADLPFPITHTPDTFSQFRKEVERYVQVRTPLDAPESLPPITVKLDAGEIPTLSILDYESFEEDPRAALTIQGGETEGLKRLHYYIWESGQLSDYKLSSDELSFEGDYSTHLSAWLSQGCVSPKTIFHEIRKYESQYGADDNTNALILSLLKRDFLRLMAKKYGDQIFHKEGPGYNSELTLENNWEKFQRWAEGKTGIPFIDAIMRAFIHSGYISYRGRMNVASYLIYDLGVNWQMGAEYFESLLIDYDIASNWGNWHYAAGVGSDSREKKQFNTPSQAQRYDSRGAFIRKWIPQLGEVSTDKFHQSDELTYAE